jgi:hypothetical protein
MSSSETDDSDDDDEEEEEYDYENFALSKPTGYLAQKEASAGGKKDFSIDNI